MAVGALLTHVESYVVSRVDLSKWAATHQFDHIGNPSGGETITIVMSPLDWEDNEDVVVTVQSDAPASGGWLISTDGTPMEDDVEFCSTWAGVVNMCNWVAADNLFDETVSEQKVRVHLAGHGYTLHAITLK